MTDLTEMVYAAGYIETTVDGLRLMFPRHAHLISSDMSDDELNALNLPWEETDYFKAMERSNKALRRSMRQTNERSQV